MSERERWIERETRIEIKINNVTGRPGLNFINILCTAFTLEDPGFAKKTVKLAVLFGTFGTFERKSCT